MYSKWPITLDLPIKINLINLIKYFSYESLSVQSQKGINSVL